MNLKNLRYSKGWIVALATIIGLSFGAYTSINRAVTSHVYVTNCGSIDYKPTALVKFCADAGVEITQIEWESWSSQKAVGTGVYEINDCEPSCVAGKLHFATVEITLRKSKSIGGKETLTFISIKTKDGKNLPLSSSTNDAWSLELAG